MQEQSEEIVLAEADTKSNYEQSSEIKYAQAAPAGLVLTRSNVTAEEKGVERWTEALHRDIWSYRQLKRRRWQKPLSLIAVGTIALIATSLLNGKWSFWNFPFWMVYLIFAGKELTDRAAFSRKEAAYEVSQIKDPKAVSVLAMATETDKDTRTIASKGLVSLLPLLTEQDAKQVPDESMKALVRLLRAPNAPLVIGILRLLQLNGDSRFIPAVQDVITNPVSYADKRSVMQRLYQTQWQYHPARDRVLDAAHETLRVLHANEAKDTLRRTLLRPAGPIEVEQSLLRPASSVPETPESQLLRPAE